jgi:MoxR-like ATPase
VQRSLEILRQTLDAALVGQEEAKLGLLLALLAREHVYLEGPPGCGKTKLAEALASGSGARTAAVRFHRDLRDTDLLGGVRLVRRRGAAGERLSREIEPGAVLQAEVLVLDDVTRAPGESLGPLLRILGERRALGRRLPLETAVATGSGAEAVTSEDVLEPSQLDRFAVQVRMRGLLTGGEFRLARSALDQSSEPVLPRLEGADRRRLQTRAARVPVDQEVRHRLVSFGVRLAGALGNDGAALVTDRAFLGAALRLVRAHALLRGREQAGPRDLAALRWMVGRRLPQSAQDVFEELLEEAVTGEEPGRISGAATAHGARQLGPGGQGRALSATRARADAVERRLEESAEAAATDAWAEVGPLLRALEGRIERARVDPGDDPGGQPRRYRPLRQLDELLDSDPIEAALFVEGRLPAAPRVFRRERRNRGGTLAVLRDVSASMEGRLSRWAGDVVTGIVKTAARRRMRVGYVEFNHEAERFTADGRFFHRGYRKLLALAARRRATGRTSYEAPLRLALREFEGRAGRNRHLVLLTDGIPVLGDPRVAGERARARQLGVEVHTVFLGLGDPPDVLDEISRETGGVRFVARPGSDGRLRVRAREAR